MFSIIIKFPVLAASPYTPSPTLIRFITDTNSSETPSWATSSNSFVVSSTVNNRVTSDDINSLTRCTAFSKIPPRSSEPYNVAEIAFSIPKRFSLIVRASRLCCRIFRVLSSSVTNLLARTFSLFFDHIRKQIATPMATITTVSRMASVVAGEMKKVRGMLTKPAAKVVINPAAKPKIQSA